MKPLIVNIMPHGPAYHFSPDEKPDFYWEKQDYTWLGFWKREWPDLLGEAILKTTDRYTWEVWQPDCRADKIYSKTIETGVLHYLFPAEERVYKTGIKSQKGIFSQAIIERIDELKNDRIILQLHGFRVPFYYEILRLFGPQKKCPIFLTGHGMSIAPISELFSIHRPLTYLSLIAEQLQLKKLLNYVDIISEQAESALSEIKKLYSGRIEKATMGCDFNFWIPAPSHEVRLSIRRKLNISETKKVFLATGNFIPRKQFDMLIKIFTKLIHRDDFFLIIAGHGDKICTDNLSSLITPLANQGKALLHTYVTGESLRDLYWASDLYVSVSTNEGSSVAIMKAMACGLPILSTPVGETTELMKKWDAGMFLPLRDNRAWTEIIKEIIDKNLPAQIDRGIAKNSYHWPNVARRFIKIYDDLFNTREKIAWKTK